MATQPRWTPDGSEITYTLVEDGTAYLAYVHTDGSGGGWLTPDRLEGGVAELRPIPS